MTPRTDIVAKSSGEIDLRALASAYDRAQDVVRDEESFELAAAPLPLLVPRAASEHGRPGALWLGIGALLLMTTTVAITVTVVTLRRQPETAAVATPPRAPLPLAGATVTSSPAPVGRAPATAPAVAQAPIAAPAVAGDAPVASPVAAAVAAPVAATAGAPRQPKSIEARSRDTAASVAGEQVASAREQIAAPVEPSASPETAAATPAEATPTPTPTPATPAATAAIAPSTSCDELTCLVEPDAPCCRRASTAAARAEAAAAASPELPSALSRAQIETALRPLRGRLQSCADRHAFAGTATIKLRIAADGAVRGASVAGGTPDFGSCAGELVAQARFPATQDGVSVRYPLILK